MPITKATVLLQTDLWERTTIKKNAFKFILRKRLKALKRHSTVKQRVTSKAKPAFCLPVTLLAICLQADQADFLQSALGMGHTHSVHEGHWDSGVERNSYWGEMHFSVEAMGEAPLLTDSLGP